MVVNKVGIGSSCFGELEMFRAEQLKHHTRILAMNISPHFPWGGYPLEVSQFLENVMVGKMVLFSAFAAVAPGLYFSRQSRSGQTSPTFCVAWDSTSGE